MSQTSHPDTTDRQSTTEDIPTPDLEADNDLAVGAAILETEFDVSAPADADDELWKNDDLLSTLYHGDGVDDFDGLSQRQIGELIGCSGRNVSYWMDKHDVPAAEQKGGHSVPYAHFKTSHNGYEIWRTSSGTERFQVNRLCAIAWADPEMSIEEVCEYVAERDAHHDNEIKWDNREENILELTPEKHRRLHVESRERDEQGRFV